MEVHTDLEVQGRGCLIGRCREEDMLWLARDPYRGRSSVRFPRYMYRWVGNGGQTRGFRAEVYFDRQIPGMM